MSSIFVNIRAGYAVSNHANISWRDDPFSSEIEKIMRFCAEEKIEGFIALHSLSIIWYVSRKAPDEERRKWIKKLCTLLTVSGTNNQLILDAIEKIVLLRGVESGSTPVKNRLRQVCVRDLLFRDKALIPVGRWIRV